MVKCITYTAAYGFAHQKTVRNGFVALLYFSYVGFHHCQFGCFELIRQTFFPPLVPDEVRTKSAVHCCESTHYTARIEGKIYYYLNSVKCEGMYIEILHKKSIHRVAEKTITNFSTLQNWLEQFSNCIFSLVMIKGIVHPKKCN